MADKKNFRRMYQVLDTWIDISASPQTVWKALVDFPAWVRWNPFIPSVQGNPQVGGRLCIKVVSPGLKPMVFKPEIFEVKLNERLVWGGSFLWFIYRGDHAFLLEPRPGGITRFRQIERFRGPMVLLMGSMIKKTEAGYHTMNSAFKRYVEDND